VGNPVAGIAGELLEAAARATEAADPGALADAIARLAGWMLEGAAALHDEGYARWLVIEPAFHALDLALWERSPVNVETLALALARVTFYRHTDLGREEVIALLARVRKLLSPRHHLACANVDLQRAELVSMRKRKEDLDHALTLCDDALASVEQLEDGTTRGDAWLTRAHVLARCSRVPEALADAEKARVIFAAHDQTQGLSNVRLFLAEMHLAGGRIPEAAILAGEAIEGFRQRRDSISEGNVLLLRAQTWKHRGKALRAFQDCEDAVRLYEVARARTSQGRALLLRAQFLSGAARYPEAQLDLETALRYLRESPEAFVFALALLRLAEVLCRRHDEEGAARRLDEAEAALGRLEHAPDQVVLLLEVCRVGKELPTPDKPRIRRCSAAALGLARALGDAEWEQAATAFAGFAGVF